MPGHVVLPGPVPHHCDQPDADECGWALGTVWACDDCGSYWRLESGFAFRSRYWFKLGLPERAWVKIKLAFQ